MRKLCRRRTSSPHRLEPRVRVDSRFGDLERVSPADGVGATELVHFELAERRTPKGMVLSSTMPSTRACCTSWIGPPKVDKSSAVPPTAVTRALSSSRKSA